MEDPNHSNPLDILLDLIADRVSKKLQAANGHNGGQEALLTPEELSERLKVPLSWVYERSRLNKIPTHRIGRYVRFDLAEVLDSLKKN